MTQSIKPLRFASNVSAGNSEELTYDVAEPATIENLEIRFYRGPEYELEIRPLVVPEGDGHAKSLVETIGQSYIAGDNDVFQFSPSEQVNKGDTIRVEIDNTATPDPNLNLSYDGVVHMQLDRMGGSNRPIMSLLNTVRSWF